MPYSPVLLIGAFKHIADKYHRVINHQVRKYTGQDYTVHTDNVERIVASVEPGNVVARAAAHGHDLYEDVFYKLTPQEFRNKMIEEITILGLLPYYNQNLSILDEAGKEFVQHILMINEAIIDLSDTFTKENYPDLNREERKAGERERLSKISDTAKTVKLADLIDNTSDITANDPNFAVTYLKEKAALLPLLAGGNPILMERAQKQVFQCEEILAHHKAEKDAKKFQEFLTKNPVPSGV